MPPTFSAEMSEVAYLEAVENLFRQADNDTDGQIDQEEFSNALLTAAESLFAADKTSLAWIAT